ncbi:MAG: hypothetical protein AAFW69_05890 [Pseudomonadota bacterium]
MGALVSAATLPLGGCGLFGGDEEEAPAPSPLAELPTDPAVRIASIRGAEVGQAADGILVQATGVAPTQGYNTAALRVVSTGADGVLVLEFVAVPPMLGAEQVAIVGPEETRTLTGVTFVPDSTLERVRILRIEAVENTAEIEFAPPDGPAEG